MSNERGCQPGDRITCRGCTGMFVVWERGQRECSLYCWRIVKRRLKRKWREQQLRNRANTIRTGEQTQ